MASVEVSEATRVILGQEPRLLNRILHCDIGNMDFQTVEVSKAENCPVCGSSPSGPPMQLGRELVREICGRDGKRVFVITPRRDLRLDLDDVHQLLNSHGFKTRVKGDLGITFEYGPNKDIASILTSGIMIIESTENKEWARAFYDKTVVDELRVPRI